MVAVHTIVGGVLVLYALIVIIKGRVTVSDGDRSSRGTSRDWITRSETPVKFWLFVMAILALAAVFLLNLFNLPF
jgi:hypothetical protein